MDDLAAELNDYIDDLAVRWLRAQGMILATPLLSNVVLHPVLAEKEIRADGELIRMMQHDIRHALLLACDGEARLDYLNKLEEECVDPSA